MPLHEQGEPDEDGLHTDAASDSAPVESAPLDALATVMEPRTMGKKEDGSENVAFGEKPSSRAVVYRALLRASHVCAESGAGTREH